MKSLYFNLAYVFLFSAKTGIYKQTHTHTQSGAENSLFQVRLPITKPFSPFYLEETTNYWSLSVSRTVIQLIMWVNKPTVAYKLVQLCSIIVKTHTQTKTVNNLTKINWDTQLINEHS